MPKNPSIGVVCGLGMHRIVRVSGTDDGQGRTALPALLIRMRDQDRAAVAEFIEAYGRLIRRRVRSKLSPKMRRVFDSLDVLSSLARRLDVVVAKGQLRAMNEAQFMAFVNQVAENTIVDQARLVRRLHRVEGADSEVVRLMRQRMLVEGDSTAVREDELLRLVESIASADDRDMVCMWMNGRSLKHIGEALGISPDATRQRWRQLKINLRAFLEREHA